MNDIMSIGSHRMWKNKFLDWMNPQPNNSLVDVASGTGDIAKLFSKKIKNSGSISCVEPNNEMYSAGKKKLKILEISDGIKHQQKGYLLKMILLIFTQLVMD